MSDALRTEVICGWVGGACGVLISHPLDCLRVVLQTDASATLPKAAATLWRAEGWSGFFKGIFSPAMSVGLWKAVLFASSNAARGRLLPVKEGIETPIADAFFGGVAAGMAGLFVQMPIERIKVVAQTSASDPRSSVLTHEWSVAKNIWRREGLRGLYRGTLINATLCPSAIGIWFGLNEGLQHQRRVQTGRSKIGLLDEFACGATAGTLAWMFNYPSDKAKAIVQSAATHKPWASDFELLAPALRREGLSFIWRGISATLLRAIPQTGTTIVAFSLCRRWMGTSTG